MPAAGRRRHRAAWRKLHGYYWNDSDGGWDPGTVPAVGIDTGARTIRQFCMQNGPSKARHPQISPPESGRTRRVSTPQRSSS